MSELKPCPWCSSEDDFVINVSIQGVTIICGECGFTLKPKKTVRQAVKNWNLKDEA